MTHSGLILGFSPPVCLCFTTTTTGPMIYRTTLGENVCKWEGKKSVRQRESEMVMNMEIYVRRIRSSFRWLESEREKGELLQSPS